MGRRSVLEFQAPANSDNGTYIAPPTMTPPTGDGFLLTVQMRRDLKTPEERFDRMFRATSDDVLAYLLRRARTPEDAADALPETYAAAWRKLDKLPDGERARLAVWRGSQRAAQVSRSRTRRGWPLC